jgi:prolyl oligopeptidase
MTKLFLSIILMTSITQKSIAQEDPYLWLEEVEGKKAMDFVIDQNKKTYEKFSQDSIYKSIYSKTLEILNSTDRIAFPSIIGNHIYNFWQDKEHVRGIWRRTTKESYLSNNPVWETLLDIDALALKDGVKWVYKGSNGLYPNYNRFIINLSNGGGDAVEIREFDVTTKSFIKGGFYIPEAKGDASYLDENTLIVSTDFGEGTMTTSGYANQVKIWKRGTLLKDAKLIHTGNIKDVASSGYAIRDNDKNYLIINQGTTFYTNILYVFENSKLIKLDLPEDVSMSTILNNQIVLNLKSDWTVNGIIYKQGSIVSANFSSLIKGIKELTLIFTPDEFTSINEVTSTKNKLLVNILTNVKSELNIYAFENGKWIKEKVNAPDFGTISIITADEFTDDYYFNFQNFLTPSSLYFANTMTNKVLTIKTLPSFFDGSKYEVNQYKTKSKDGTLIPYFIITSKSVVYDGTNPTLLYGYGGFEVSLEPSYSGTMGNAWLENGGIYVLSNIRGGGEYGPKWHQAGLKEKRQNVYDDFHSISEDLIAKEITSSKHLGIMGGSNGGLLMGVSFTQRPDLYSAVVCQVPLLDMKRFNKLLAGASWMGEYGDPDIAEEWEYIKKYSPYQNLKAGVKYPEVFFTTSTRDDRVHPAHARKMAAKMIDMGYAVYYNESTEGGHAGSITNEQKAKSVALEYTFLWSKLKK